MRSVVCWLAGAVLLSGCATFKSDRSQNKTTSPHEQVEAAQRTILVGTVVSVKTDLGFAVLNFPVGSVPASDRRLNVYRRGVKVGEVKVTGPQQDDNIVGDVVSGYVEPGDEIRDD